MMQLWYGDMIHFMRDASEYGAYNQELAILKFRTSDIPDHALKKYFAAL